jgi:hypothetical protein
LVASLYAYGINLPQVEFKIWQLLLCQYV